MTVTLYIPFISCNQYLYFLDLNFPLLLVRLFQVDGSSTTLSMSVHFKLLKRLIQEPTFSQVLIPRQSVLIPTLPSTGGANPAHDAFPGPWVYLAGFDDNVSTQIT